MSGVSPTDFYSRTRCTSSQMRHAETLGIIKPQRAGETGPRIFSEEDVKAMNAWDGNRRKPKPKKRPRGPEPQDTHAA